MSHKYDVLLVGAGLFNAVLCTRLIKAGRKVLVLEKRNHIAGNCYDEPGPNAILTHKYGAHIFHTDYEDVWSFVNQYSCFNDFINSPLAVYDDSAVYNLPFNLNTFCQIYSAPPNEAIKLLKHDIDAYKVEHPSNFTEQAISMVGPLVFHRLIKYYTEKQWGKSCDELDASIIKRIPLRFYADNNYFADKYQGIPVDGYTDMIKRMFEGAEIQLGVDYLQDKEYWNEQASKVYYSGCIDAYYDYIFGTLEYRSLRFEERLDTLNHTQYNAVVNYTGPDVPYTRTIEHIYFSHTKGVDDLPQNTQIIRTYEYPASWNIGDEPYYPVQNVATNELLRKYQDIKNEKVSFVGRLGMFRYLDMDDTIKLALDYPIV